MGKYTTMLGKWTIASLLLTTPILTALPVGNAQAAATTVADVTTLLDELPQAEDFTFTTDADAFYAMQVVCDTLGYADKQVITKTEKYKALYAKVIAGMKAAYPEENRSDTAVFKSFTSTFELKGLLQPGAIKPFEELTLADKPFLDKVKTLKIQH